ncbi:hypothetical protein K438DRAFT_1040358 [Mycena galopus ATCC 62051]|nr:hypothetical protein K438DRAFT_1040358 [Mycena galopus ATCC 62051]
MNANAEESIERNAVNLESLPQSSVQNSLFPPSNISEDVPDALPPVPARREYVWRNIDRGQQSLASIAGRITLDLDLKLSPVLRLNSTNAKSPHRCPGYIREEITLAATIFDSAVVSHDTPSPLEICSVCHEVVGTHDAFKCVCGDSEPGSRHTVKCQVCKVWSHTDCVGKPREFKCVSCSNVPHDFGVQPARAEGSEEVAKQKQTEAVGVFRCVCGDLTRCARHHPMSRMQDWKPPRVSWQCQGV